jgi:serine/threonine protein kinase
MIRKSVIVAYDALKMIGHGSFGAVFLAEVIGTGEMVAIKKFLQDRRFKNRELEIMKQLSAHPHPYIVNLKQHFFSKSKSQEIYVNLVLEYVPETIYSVNKHFVKRKELMPIFLVKLYMYQLCRALAHIHGMGICHR